MADRMEQALGIQNKRKNMAWLYLAIPLLLVGAVAFNYGKGYIQEKQAEKVIEEYVQATYGDKLDKFQHAMGDQGDFNGLYTKVTAYYRYYYLPDMWGGFEIKADLDGNIVYDGYKDWYLLGGASVQHYSDLYMHNEYDLKNDIYAKAVQDGLFTMKDEFTVSADFRYITKASENGHGSVLVEPLLDPEKEYDLDRLAREHGELFVMLTTDRFSQEDFAEYAQFCAQFIKGTDWQYKTLVLYLQPDTAEDIVYRAACLTMEEVATGDIPQLIADKAFVYTQQDRTRDVQAINNGGRWTEEYGYAFAGRIHTSGFAATLVQ